MPYFTDKQPKKELKDMFPKAEIALGGCTENKNIDDEPMIGEALLLWFRGGEGRPR